MIKGEPITTYSYLMKVIVKKVGNNEQFELECDEDETIESLKQKINAVTRIPVERQRLIFQGHPIQHGTLRESGITDNTKIFISERLLSEPSSAPSEATHPPPSEQQTPNPMFPNIMQGMQGGFPTFAIPITIPLDGSQDTSLPNVMNMMGQMVNNMIQDFSRQAVQQSGPGPHAFSFGMGPLNLFPMGQQGQNGGLAASSPSTPQHPPATPSTPDRTVNTAGTHTPHTPQSSTQSAPSTSTAPPPESPRQ